MPDKTVTLTEQQIEELTNGLSIAIGKYRDSIALINRESGPALPMQPVVQRFQRRISECDLILRKIMDTPAGHPPGVSLREMCDKEQGAVLIHVSGHRGVGKTVVTDTITKHLRDKDLIVHVETGTHMPRRGERERQDEARKAAHVIIEDRT